MKLMIYRVFFIFIILSFSFNVVADEESIFTKLNQVETDENSQTCNVTLVALNKITTKSRKISLKESESIIFDNLTITVNKSFINPEKKESSALISVLEKKVDSDPIMLFQGWIISPKQSLSTMNHPIYEILMIDCK